MQAPQNLVCTGESQEITLSYAGSNVEKVMGSVTFKNDRQKASVSVYKQDKETRKYLPGGTYGLYAGNDIKAADGTVVVKKDILIWINCRETSFRQNLSNTFTTVERRYPS